MAIVEVRVQQLVPNRQLDREDHDARVAQSYRISVPSDLPEGTMTSIALEEFHSRVRIAAPSNYRIRTYIKGIEVHQWEDDFFMPDNYEESYRECCH